MPEQEMQMMMSSMQTSRKYKILFKNSMGFSGNTRKPYSVILYPKGYSKGVLVGSKKEKLWQKKEIIMRF